MLRVAYIPEHFSTPMFLAAAKGSFAQRGLDVKFVPVIEGSGRLIKLLESKEVDVAVGLTEAFIADIAKGATAYKTVATYVQSPLCWAVSTGAKRDDLTSLDQLQGKTIGISRLGSGSHVMSYVLGNRHKFTEPYFKDHKILSNFANLRAAVNAKDADAFMWEYFTTKKYYDSGEIKQIGEIYTPWPSWVVSVTTDAWTEKTAVEKFLAAVNEGVAHFNADPREAVDHITANLDYTEADANEWLKTVKFADATKRVDPAVVESTIALLRSAGVIEDPEDVVQSRLASGIPK